MGNGALAIGPKLPRPSSTLPLLPCDAAYTVLDGSDLKEHGSHRQEEAIGLARCLIGTKALLVPAPWYGRRLQQGRISHFPRWRRPAHAVERIRASALP
jgi:hypothetical protein